LLSLLLPARKRRERGLEKIPGRLIVAGRQFFGGAA